MSPWAQSNSMCVAVLATVNAMWSPPHMPVGTAEGPDGLEPQAEAAATARRYRGRVSRDGRVMIDFLVLPSARWARSSNPSARSARTNRRHGKTVEARCGSRAPGTVHSFNACADQCTTGAQPALSLRLGPQIQTLLS